jgi:uncharacterized DUF497 family protein
MSSPPNAHPYHKRRHFYDSEGNDWEFGQYLQEGNGEEVIRIISARRATPSEKENGAAGSLPSLK